MYPVRYIIWMYKVVSLMMGKQGNSGRKGSQVQWFCRAFALMVILLFIIPAVSNGTTRFVRGGTTLPPGVEKELASSLFKDYIYKLTYCPTFPSGDYVSLTISAPPSADPYAAISVTGRVVNSSLKPFSGYTVTMSASPPTTGVTFPNAVTQPDGSYSTTFTATGPMRFTLSATISPGCDYLTTSKTTPVTVNNKAPTATFTVDPGLNAGSAPVTVTFDASGSSDPDSDGIASYAWNFGDPTSDQNTATVVKPSHTYLNPGNYPVTLKVTDYGNPSITPTIPAISTDATPQTIIVSPPPTTITTTTAPPTTTTEAPPTTTTTAPPTTTTQKPSTPTPTPAVSQQATPPPAPQAFSVSFSPLTGPVEPGKPANLVIHVMGPGNVPVPGASVALSSTQGGALSPPSGTTDGSGSFPATFIAPAEGSYVVNVTITKDGFQAGAQSLPVTVGGGGGFGGLPLGLILPLLVILILVALIVAYLWTRNNLQLVLKQKDVPADGTSTIPIRVQFANGFGQLRKQRLDREVTLEATSGTLKAANLPEGKAFVDTNLTASRECGKVKVTARYEKQRAEGTVEFLCVGGIVETISTPPEIPADGKSAANLVIRIKDKSGNILSFLDEKTVNLSTTLGTIPSPVRVPARSQDIRATLTSGQVSGIATVTATLDQMKGEATVKFTSLGKRFCMHCGAPMGMDAPNCPACGKTPPSGIDTKACPACGAVLPVSALYCDKCGAKQAK